MLKTLVAALAVAAALGGLGGTAVAGDCDTNGGQDTCCYPIDTPVYKYTPCFSDGDMLFKVVKH